MLSETVKVWFITGASTGFGREMVQVALSEGDTVIATLWRPEALADLAEKWPKDKLHVLKLDVTRPSEITEAFAYAKNKVGRIDVIYNNAGIGASTLVEPIAGTEVATRWILEVNFWGALHVMQEAVKFMREVNPPGVGGHIINCSSASGIICLPSSGYYAASKHALEAVSESLSQELLPAWNIKITIAEPGVFATPIHDRESRITLMSHPAYVDINGRPLIPTVTARYPIAGNAAKAAKAFWRLSRMENPPLRLPLGKDALGAIISWGEGLVKGAREAASWSNDVAISDSF